MSEEPEVEEAIHIPLFSMWMTIRNPNDDDKESWVIKFVPSSAYEKFSSIMTSATLADIVAVIVQHTIDAKAEGDQIQFVKDFKKELKENLDEGVLLDPVSF
jgi:hypothetical protein